MFGLSCVPSLANLPELTGSPTRARPPRRNTEPIGYWSGGCDEEEVEDVAFVEFVGETSPARRRPRSWRGGWGDVLGGGARPTSERLGRAERVEPTAWTRSGRRWTSEKPRSARRTASPTPRAAADGARRPDPSRLFVYERPRRVQGGHGTSAKSAPAGRCVRIDDAEIATSHAHFMRNRPDFKMWAPITACATDFVTSRLLESDDVFKQMRLVTIVRDAFAADVEAFRREHSLRPSQLHFIFKGGNVMRFVLTSMMLQHPNLAADVSSFYMDVFKPSDLDFGIVIDTDAGRGPSVAAVHALSARLARSMVELRARLMAEPDEVFPLLTQSQPAIDAELARVHEQMRAKVDAHNKATPPDGVRLPAIMQVVGAGASSPKIVAERLGDAATRRDMTITFEDERDALARIRADRDADPPRVVCEAPADGQRLFVSRNESLLFYAGGGDQLVHFDLVRMKLAFSLRTRDLDGTLATKHVGGEVIDLSVTHTDGGSNAAPRFERLEGSALRPAEPYVRYELWTVDGIKYGVDSYSISGLIADIVRILFLEPEYPWLDAKYAKRLARIMGLLLCEALHERNAGMPSERLTEAMRACVTGAPRLADGSVWALVQRQVDRMRALAPTMVEARTLLDDLTYLMEGNLELLRTEEEGYAPYRMLVVPSAT
jgi:hypothetical protein